jgi:predicted metal-dependent hydrolase
VISRSDNESIKDTLDVIRRALEDETEFSKKNDNVLMLNKKVNDDGTVNLLNQSEDFNEVNKVIDKKLSDLLEKKMNSMLESKLPQILDNYFKNKK